MSLYALIPDAEALQEVILANPGERIVFSYTSDLYLGERNIPFPPEESRNGENSEKEESQARD